MTKRSVTKKPNLTKWLKGNPQIEGVYQIAPFGISGVVRYSFWDGKFWSYFSSKIEDFDDPESFVFFNRHRELFPWRGLAQNPEVQP